MAITFLRFCVLRTLTPLDFTAFTRRFCKNTRTTSERILLRSDFCLQKNQSHASSFLLFREKSRSVACSFVNAHATAYNRCQLFTILCLRCSQNSLPLLRLQISLVRTPAPRRSGLCSVTIFFLYKNNLYILTLHLF